MYSNYVLQLYTPTKLGPFIYSSLGTAAAACASRHCGQRLECIECIYARAAIGVSSLRLIPPRLNPKRLTRLDGWPGKCAGGGCSSGGAVGRVGGGCTRCHTWHVSPLRTWNRIQLNRCASVTLTRVTSADLTVAHPLHSSVSPLRT